MAKRRNYQGERETAVRRGKRGTFFVTFFMSKDLAPERARIAVGAIIGE
jgi:hypothetical protein